MTLTYASPVSVRPAPPFIRKTDIRQSLLPISCTPHRLQYVATVHDVMFIDDSYSVNVNSGWYALESMFTPTVLIISASSGEQTDYSGLDALVADKCHTLVFLGTDNTSLHAHFDRLGKEHRLTLIDTDNLQKAVQASYHAARSGDTVLFSPCAEGRDLFCDYQDRGMQFTQTVRAL